MPQRIQRTRKKGYRTPLGSLYVGRPTKWGNPFKTGGTGSDMIYGNASYRRKILDPYIFIEVVHPDRIHERIVELYTEWLNGANPWYINPCELTKDEIKAALAGKNLSCWCPAHKKCHADVLIEIANS